MAYPSTASRPATLLLVLFTTLAGLTLTGVSAASSAPSHKDHRPAPQHAPLSASKSKPSLESKHPQASPQAHRKAPAKTRVAAKSKAPKRAHQTPPKPAKLATKKAKSAA